MKKLLTSLLLVLVLIPSTSFASFSDVNDSTDYKIAIKYMAENGVIQGYPNGTFKPNNCVNRVEFLKMLFLTNQTEISDVQGSTFPDVDSTQWYGPYVSTAFYGKNRIIDGYPDGTFQPSKCVNRVEAIKMAILEFNNGEIPTTEEGLWAFHDVDRTQWYGQFIVPALFNDYVGTKHMTAIGVEGGNFYPEGAMNRKEVAEMLYRMKAVKDKNATIYNTNLKPNTISQQSILSYNGPAQFKLDFDTIPCSEYAYDSAICSNDPNASVET